MGATYLLTEAAVGGLFLGNLWHLGGIPVSASVQEVVCSTGNIRVNIMQVCLLFPALSSPFSTSVSPRIPSHSKRAAEVAKPEFLRALALLG